jgi:hypothetical protein
VDWILIVPLAAFALLALAGWLVVWHNASDYSTVKADYSNVKAQRDRLNTRNAELCLANVQQSERIVQLQDQLAESEDSVQWLIDEVVRLQKSADHATIPLAETVQPDPEPVKPVRSRKKAGTA